MSTILRCLCILLFINPVWGRLPCDGDYNPELGLTGKERDILGLVDMLNGPQLFRSQIAQIETSIRDYLIQAKIPFQEKNIQFTEADFGILPENIDATLFEVKLPGEFSKKLYYSPQMEVFRLQNSNQILKYDDGLVLSIKDLYYFERSQVTERIKKSVENPLGNFGEIPKLENKVEFMQYLKAVENHLMNQNMDFEIFGQGVDVGFIISPHSKKGSKLNNLAAAVYEKFDEAKVVFYPSAIKKENASGMFSPSKNTIYISHESVVTAKVDYVVVHELMHANLFNRYLMEGKFSPFHGDITPLAGKKLSGLSAYEKYVSLEEVATHALNVHMAGKKLWLNWEMPRIQRKYVDQLRSKAKLANEISYKAMNMMDEALKKLENDTLYLRGHESGNGFTMMVVNDEYSAVIPLLFRNESEEIRTIAAKYPTKNDAVTASDVKKLKKYLQEILFERKTLYQDLAFSYQELLLFLDTKIQSANRFGFRFDELEMKELLKKSSAARSKAIDLNFEEAPEVKSTFKAFLEWLKF